MIFEETKISNIGGKILKIKLKDHEDSCLKISRLHDNIIQFLQLTFRNINLVCGVRGQLTSSINITKNSLRLSIVSWNIRV